MRSRFVCGAAAIAHVLHAEPLLHSPVQPRLFALVSEEIIKSDGGIFNMLLEQYRGCLDIVRIDCR